MDEGQQNSSMSKGRSAWILWAGFSASIVSYGIVSISGRELNLSLFDILLPVAVLLVSIGEWARMPGVIRSLAVNMECRLALCAGVLVFIHAALTIAGPSEVVLAGVLRESLKSAGFFGQVLLVALLFRTLNPRLPSFRSLFLLVLAVSTISVARHYHELNPLGDGSWFLPRNLHLALLGTVLLVSYAKLGSETARTGRFYTLASHALCILVSFILFNKAMVAVLILVLPILWLRMTRRAIVLLFAGGIALAIVALVTLDGLSEVTRAEGVRESLSVRLAMWEVSLKAGVAEFPWGIGLGQLPMILQHVPEGAKSAVDASGNITFVQNVWLAHNVFIAHFAEMGMFGVLLMGVLIALVARACWRFPAPLALAAMMMIFVPMMLQDALGLRAIPLLLGFAIVWRPDSPMGTEDSRLA